MFYEVEEVFVDSLDIMFIGEVFGMVGLGFESCWVEIGVELV